MNRIPKFELFESSGNREKEMIDGIVRMLLMVRDLKNRTEIAERMLEDFAKEKIEVDETEFLTRCKVIDKKGNYLHD